MWRKEEDIWRNSASKWQICLICFIPRNLRFSWDRTILIWKRLFLELKVENDLRFSLRFWTLYRCKVQKIWSRNTKWISNIYQEYLFFKFTKINFLFLKKKEINTELVMKITGFQNFLKKVSAMIGVNFKISHFKIFLFYQIFKI